MPIPDELLKQMKCCLNSDGHIVHEPILITFCGANACKSCILNLKIYESYKCNYCQNEHKKEELLKMPINPTVKILVEQTFYQELMDNTNKKIEQIVEEHTENQMKNNILKRVEMIESQIDIRTESLISEIKKYREEFNNELHEWKESILKNFNDKFNKIHENFTNVNFGEYSNNNIIESKHVLSEYQNASKEFKQELEKINFKINNFKISKEMIGKIVDKKSILKNYSTMRTIEKLEIKPHLFVKTQKGKLITLRYNSNNTIYYIKYYLAIKLSNSITNDFVLYFNNERLLEDKTLSDYKIEPETILELKSKIPIYVKGCINKKLFKIDQSDKIENFKIRIEREEGIASHKQWLIHDNEILHNNKTFNDYNLKPYSVIYLNVKSGF